MKRYVLGILLVFALLVPSAQANEQVFGFMDNKFYDVKAELKYFGFMDGTFFDVAGKQVWRDGASFTYTKPAVTPAPVVSTPIASAPHDTCPNIDGDQGTEPVGMVKLNGLCLYPTNPEKTCTEQITLAGQQLFDAKVKYEHDIAVIDPQDGSSTAKVYQAKETYKSDTLRLDLTIKQLQAGYMCKA